MIWLLKNKKVFLSESLFGRRKSFFLVFTQVHKTALKQFRDVLAAAFFSGGKRRDYPGLFWRGNDHLKII